MLRGIIYGMVMLAVVTLVLGPVHGDDWIVDDDAGTWRTHHTIQDAINQSSAGDNISVYAGTYNEDVVVNQTVRIIGNGSGETVINGSAWATAVLISVNHVNITGVSINATPFTYGIDVDGHYVTVDNGSITNCSTGIHSSAIYGRFDNLTISDCEYGAYYDFLSGWHYMRECTFDNMLTASISMYYSENNIFRECVFAEKGVEIGGGSVDYFEHHTIHNCRIAGPGWKAVVYDDMGDNFTFQRDDNIGQLILVNVDNVTIENTDFETGGWPIVLAYSKNIEIRNMTITNATNGYTIMNSNNVTFQNVSISGMSGSSIYAEGSPNCVLDGVNVTDCEYGFWTTNGGGYSTLSYFNVTDTYRPIHCFDPYVTVENSTFTDCQSPVYVYDHNFTMRHCLINGTSSSGCYLRSSYSLYENNTFRDIGTYGFFMTDPVTRGNVIIYNEIFNTNNYAIWMRSGANNNTVHHNNFANNDRDPQCSDDGVDNMWDDGAEGNYWDDWNGTGNYTLDGSAKSADEHPLGDPEDTSAPEKVPELHVMASMIGLLGAVFILRRRR